MLDAEADIRSDFAQQAACARNDAPGCRCIVPTLPLQVLLAPMPAALNTGDRLSTSILNARHPTPYEVGQRPGTSCAPPNVSRATLSHVGYVLRPSAALRRRIRCVSWTDLDSDGRNCDGALPARVIGRDGAVASDVCVPGCPPRAAWCDAPVSFAVSAARGCFADVRAPAATATPASAVALSPAATASPDSAAAVSPTATAAVPPASKSAANAATANAATANASDAPLHASPPALRWFRDGRRDGGPLGACCRAWPATGLEEAMAMQDRLVPTAAPRRVAAAAAGRKPIALHNEIVLDRNELLPSDGSGDGPGGDGGSLVKAVEAVFVRAHAPAGAMAWARAAHASISLQRRLPQEHAPPLPLLTYDAEARMGEPFAPVL